MSAWERKRIVEGIIAMNETWNEIMDMAYFALELYFVRNVDVSVLQKVNEIPTACPVKVKRIQLRGR